MATAPSAPRASPTCRGGPTEERPLPTGIRTRGRTVAWSRFLATLPGAPRVVLNVEHYAIDCSTGAFGPAASQDIVERESFYRAEGATLGPAFEIRYWANLLG